MKKNVKTSDLIDIQLVSHNNFDEPLKRETAAAVLEDNHITSYSPSDGNCHNIAIAKDNLWDAKTICGYFLLDVEGNEITISDISKILNPETESD